MTPNAYDEHLRCHFASLSFTEKRALFCKEFLFSKFLEKVSFYTSGLIQQIKQPVIFDNEAARLCLNGACVYFTQVIVNQEEAGVSGLQPSEAQVSGPKVAAVVVLNETLQKDSGSERIRNTRPDLVGRKASLRQMGIVVAVGEFGSEGFTDTKSQRVA